MNSCEYGKRVVYFLGVMDDSSPKSWRYHPAFYGSNILHMSEYWDDPMNGHSFMPLTYERMQYPAIIPSNKTRSLQHPAYQPPKKPDWGETLGEIPSINTTTYQSSTLSSTISCETSGESSLFGATCKEYNWHV